jgi:hypothetical protein
MAEAPHRGVDPDDPRNLGVIERFRPPPMTPAHLRARFARVFRTDTPAELDARVESFLADIAARPHRPPPPLSQALGDVADPLWGLSTHPDLIEGLWGLERGLPRRCRWVVWGYPALVHPQSGVIFALAFGTIGLAVRLPPALREGLSAAPPHARDDSYDLVSAGPEWRFPPRARQEELIRAAFDYAAATPGGPST